MGSFFQVKHLVARANGAYVEERYAALVSRIESMLSDHRALPVRNDLGMLAVLRNIVVEAIATSGVASDDEVGFVRGTVGENDRRVIMGVEKSEHIASK